MNTSNILKLVLLPCQKSFIPVSLFEIYRQTSYFCSLNRLHTMLKPTLCLCVFCEVKRTHPIKIIQNLMKEEKTEAPEVPKKKQTTPNLLKDFTDPKTFLADLVKHGGTEPHSFM